jgi:predicted dehydrogenase
MDKLRVGIIGCGYMGWFHARVYHESFGAELVAIADKSEDARAKVKSAFGCEVFDDYQGMLSRADIDVVDICMPDEMHVAPAVAAAAAGKHMLIEKPMATSVKDCLKIKNACDSAGVRFMVAHLLRFDPGYRRLYNAVKNGEAGEVIHLSAERKNPRLIAERLQGRASMLFYAGVHDIDLVQWIAQKQITKVYAQRISKLNKPWNTDDCIYILANLGEDTIANIEYSWVLPKSFPSRLKSKMEVYGSRAALFLNRPDRGVEIFKEKDAELPHEFTDVLHWPDLEGFIVGDLKYQIEHFIRAVKAKSDFLMDGRDAISAINVIEAITRSYETGKAVNVPEIAY